jgi:phosphate transport system substrate-binding protein
MIHRSRTLFVFVLSLILLAGCAGKSSPPPAAQQPVPAKPAADRFIVAGSGTNLPITVKLAAAYNRKNAPAVEVPKSIGSDGAVKAVQAGTLKLGLASRPLTAAEKAAGLKEIPYARVAIIFAAHPDVPDTGVTVADIVAIHRGEKTAWSDGTNIIVLIRGMHDSSNQVIFGLIPGFDKIIERSIAQKRWQVTYHDIDMADGLRTKKGAFGHTDSTEVKVNGGIKVLAVDGKTPTADAVRSGAYPWVKNLTFIYKGELSPRAKAFVAFASSPEGRAIITDNGGTPLE